MLMKAEEGSWLFNKLIRWSVVIFVIFLNLHLHVNRVDRFTLKGQTKASTADTLSSFAHWILAACSLQLLHHSLETTHSTHLLENARINHSGHLLAEFLHLGRVYITSIHFSILELELIQKPGNWPTLKSPLIPPIFLTISANFLYWLNRSLTSWIAVPLPRATRATLDDSFVNMSFAFGWSSSETREIRIDWLENWTVVCHAVHNCHKALQTCHRFLLVSFRHEI